MTEAEIVYLIERRRRAMKRLERRDLRRINSVTTCLIVIVVWLTACVVPFVMRRWD